MAAFPRQILNFSKAVGVGGMGGGRGGGHPSHTHPVFRRPNIQNHATRLLCYIQMLLNIEKKKKTVEQDKEHSKTLLVNKGPDFNHGQITLIYKHG